jgi:hypothetical protein
LGEGFDPRRVDDADAKTQAVEVHRQGFPIGTRRLHANADVAGMAIAQPCSQVFEASLRVWEDLLGLTAVAQQRGVKRIFEISIPRNDAIDAAS